MKKKKWSNPKINNLSITETLAPSLLGPNLDYPGRIQCLSCNKVFEGGSQYEGHKVDDFSTSGILLGTECPSAPKGDNKLYAEFSILS